MIYIFLNFVAVFGVVTGLVLALIRKLYRRLPTLGLLLGSVAVTLFALPCVQILILLLRGTLY